MKEKRKNPQNSGQAQPRRKEKGTRYTKYEIKEQKYQPILQKYKNNVGEHNEQLHANKFENLEETDSSRNIQPTKTESRRNR